MVVKQDLIAMGFGKEPVSAGTHMCLIYSHDNERRKVIGKYLASGILSKEKVSYFADVMKPDEVREWLLSMDVELPTDNSFSILAAENFYCPENQFMPEKTLNAIMEYYEEAKKVGYSNARISCEMSWALNGLHGADCLMEYESLLNDILITHPVTAICQYDANKFSGTAILDVLRVHPMMVVHGHIVHNPYYMKPQSFLKNYLPGL